jgi:hypothetical protein
MRVSLFPKFGALNSTPVFAAIREGFNHLGFTVCEHDINADMAVIWSVVWAGRMRPNKDIFQQFRSTNRHVMIVEVGMIQRGHTWKIALNGTAGDNYGTGILDHDRPRHLGMDLRPWSTQGRNIIIATQRRDSLQWSGQPDTAIWVDSVIANLRAVTDRPIQVRMHPRQHAKLSKDVAYIPAKKLPNTYDDFDFVQSLSDCWALINWNSSPGPVAVIKGIQAYVGATSLASPVADFDLSQIDNPRHDDRSHWLIDLSHTEWTIPEISAGIPIKRLLHL